jgi:predicted metal-binding protein
VSTLFVCITCRREGDSPVGPRAGLRLRAALEHEAGDLEVVGVECLSNCRYGCSAAVSATGKWTYVVGHLDPEQHAGDMAAFARLHRSSIDGLTVWRDRPQHVRNNTIARVPPMPIAKEPS